MSRGHGLIAVAPPKSVWLLMILALSALLIAFRNQSEAVMALGAAGLDDSHLDDSVEGVPVSVDGSAIESESQKMFMNMQDIQDSRDETSPVAEYLSNTASENDIDELEISTPQESSQSNLQKLQDEQPVAKPEQGPADGPVSEEEIDAATIEDLEERDERTNRDHSKVHVSNNIWPVRNLLKESAGCKSTGPKPVTFRKTPGGKKPCGGRLNFLFMVIDTIYHPELWKAFLAQAPRGAYRLYVHCKKPQCSQGMFEILPTLKRVTRKASSRCLDLVTVEASLVKTALKDYVSGADVLQKYVIVTDSSLPVKPFSVVYDTLFQHRESDFCFFREDWWPKTFMEYVKLSPTRIMLQRGGKKPSLLVKHSQFVVLNRADAETFAKNWIPVNRSRPSSFKVPLKADRWTKGMRFVTPPAVPSFAFNFHKNRKIPFVGMCADEFAVFSTLYGTFEKNEFGEKQCPLNYSTSCKSIEKLLAQKRCYTLSIAGRGNDLINEIHDDVGSHLDFGKMGHPCTFAAVSRKSWQRLRWSEFLFARKFPHNATLDDYTSIVLS